MLSDKVRCKGQRTPYVYIFGFVLRFAAVTAHKPTHRESTSLSYDLSVSHTTAEGRGIGKNSTMWKESAIRANE